jgi:RNA polymerase sigma-70 factor (ECF subfamily)
LGGGFSRQRERSRERNKGRDNRTKRHSCTCLDTSFCSRFLFRRSGGCACAAAARQRVESTIDLILQVAVAMKSDSVIDRLLLRVADDSPAASADLERDVLALFDQCAPPLMRYVASFGMNAAETEDIVQDVFLLLFRHLRLGRPRSNLKGWLFQVAHHLALRQRRQRRRRTASVSSSWDDSILARHVDPSPNPEAQLAQARRQRRLQSVLQALPDRDRRCVSLRADGLRYREIAATLGISLGAVAKSIARAMARLMVADQW